jgi:hypothetical protein
VTTYRATVRVEDDTLHTARPLLAPDPVGTLIDSVAWDVANSGGQVTAATLIVESAVDSDTPVGDGIAAESHEPLPGGRRHADEHPDDDGDEGPATVAVPAVGGQA